MHNIILKIIIIVCTACIFKLAVDATYFILCKLLKLLNIFLGGIYMDKKIWKMLLLSCSVSIVMLTIVGFIILLLLRLFGIV